MKLELLKPWRGFRAGHVFPAVPDGQANLMIRLGFARPAEAAAPAPAPAAPKPVHHRKGGR